MKRTIAVAGTIGAGKTSLVQTRLVPALLQDSFEVLSPVRLRSFGPDDPRPETIANPYTFGTILNWTGSATVPTGSCNT